eukprot:TRINITY_DN1977_c0_g1_i13.p1 TRINITY_DN1977_c0_g1~~TRINITY_DN1977_c0_g1_i13.p1  ORF type:complete len:382 (+),score=79.88 TRINITY_DN1977_c0_g1_i13:712-1857(+)
MVIAGGVQKLTQLFDIFSYFPSFIERLSILGTLTSALDLLVATNLITRLYLLIAEIENVPALYGTKMNILRVFALLSNCVELSRADVVGTTTAGLVQKCVEMVSAPPVAAAVFKELSNPAIEIRVQALYTLGMFASNHIPSLNLILYTQGGLQTLLSLLLSSPSPQLYSLANWSLCIVLKNYLSLDMLAKAGLAVEYVAATVAQATMYQDNVNVLAIAVLCQSYLLPLCSSTLEIKGAINRILSLLFMTNPELQRSCLIALRRTIFRNEILCIEIVNGMFVPGLISILSSESAPPDNKLECLGIFNSLILKEHHAVIFAVRVEGARQQTAGDAGTAAERKQTVPMGHYMHLQEHKHGSESLCGVRFNAQIANCCTGMFQSK